MTESDESAREASGTQGCMGQYDSQSFELT